MKPERVFLILFVLLIACNQESDKIKTASLTLTFKHRVFGKMVVYDSLMYKNTAGNFYEISNIQWFISDLTLLDDQLHPYSLSPENWIHYVDSDLPETQTWTLEGINPGNFKGLMFVFGIKGEKNTPNMFTDPPESNMMWPYEMGGEFGGYHYMKLNGFWINSAGERTPFNLHLGVGQDYNSSGNITGFIQNWFEVFLTDTIIALPENKTMQANLVMNVESWFDTPHIYDFNKYGGMIMKNQEAMGVLRDNGNDVFSIEFMKNAP